MPTVEFTQFLRPNGQRRTIDLTVDEETRGKAGLLQEAGYDFEAEILSDDRTVSLEICKEDEEGEVETLALKLVPNGPKVQDAIQDLVDEAFNVWIKMYG